MKLLSKTILLIALISYSIACSKKSTNSDDNVVSSIDTVAEKETQSVADFKAWNGMFLNFEVGGIRLEGDGSTLKAFDDDNAPLEVELLPDGKVLIDGAEAYVSNDTLRLVISGSGGSSESVYVKTLNDMN